ncbi:SPOSA6832_03643, partial [Sporobolomyces salmonicolor]
MPLLPFDGQSPEAVLSQIPSSTSPSAPHYLIFFAPWCPDCLATQSAIEQRVPESNSTLVYVGERQQCVIFRSDSTDTPRADRRPARWKTPDNPFRKAPFNISKIPTIVRVEQGGEALHGSLESAPRLVEGELRDDAKFEQFVKA